MSYIRNYLFVIILTACQILLILSFLLRGYRRGGLILVVVLILMLGLMFITKHAPSAYVPDIRKYGLLIKTQDYELLTINHFEIL